ncbi:hypothetical protein [Streptomyces sp. CB03238]|uniref:hypothetical protein n=1 Tax=Streptomyces sp. CB03238 TaxID=1907777 RepID=UPI0015C4DC6F|nr:hypothetical protein [Streptomyces sp. CB03238]
MTETGACAPSRGSYRWTGRGINGFLTAAGTQEFLAAVDRATVQAARRAQAAR